MEYEKQYQGADMAAGVTEKPSRLREEMERLAKEAETTSKLVDRLDSRLTPIMNINPSKSLLEGTGAEEMLPQHVQDIKSRRQLLEGVNSRLQYILKNIEI